MPKRDTSNEAWGQTGPLSKRALRDELELLREGFRLDVRFEIANALELWGSRGPPFTILRGAAHPPDKAMKVVGAASPLPPVIADVQLPSAVPPEIEEVTEVGMTHWDPGAPPGLHPKSSRYGSSTYTQRAIGTNGTDSFTLGTMKMRSTLASNGQWIQDVDTLAMDKYCLPPGDSIHDDHVLTTCQHRPTIDLSLTQSENTLYPTPVKEEVEDGRLKTAQSVSPRDPCRSLPFGTSTPTPRPTRTVRRKTLKRMGTAASRIFFRGPTNDDARLSWSDLGDMIIAVSIALNGLFFGLQANFSAENTTDAVPLFFSFAELVFCIIFTTELGTRLWKHKIRFFYAEGWQWNWFDSFLVILQLLDVAVELLFGSENSAIGTATAMKNVAFLRLLRLMRLLRILRLVRLLQFFGELNVVTSAIIGSIKSLCGTLLLIMLMMYIVGIVFTQVVTEYRIELLVDGETDTNLVYWWGSLFRSILTLYQSILGGVDWDDVTNPLMQISPVWAIGFSFYIAFVCLAMMNVITGIFVESALKNAENEKDKSFIAHVRGIYDLYASDASGVIHREEFDTLAKDQEFQQQMKEIGVDVKMAKNLFNLLDEDASDSIDCEELLNGLVRLRAGARYLDILTVLGEVDKQKRRFYAWMQRSDELITRIEASLGESTTHAHADG